MTNNSREKILQALAANKGDSVLPAEWRASEIGGSRSGFKDALNRIGGNVIYFKTLAGLREYLHQHVPSDQRVVSTFLELEQNVQDNGNTMHPLDNVEIAILKGMFCVEENGAVWITDSLVRDRVLPFICQHLFIVLPSTQIVKDMHQAYARVGLTDFEFGCFVAGPSRTADIEQSLVMGAHGPKDLTVVFIEELS